MAGGEARIHRGRVKCTGAGSKERSTAEGYNRREEGVGRRVADGRRGERGGKDTIKNSIGSKIYTSWVEEGSMSGQCPSAEHLQTQSNK